MTPVKPLSKGEFVALMAALSATVAMSIDAMLPALPEIAASLAPEAPNRAQLVVTSFVFGMGLGTLFAGPLSDAFGRKAMILAGSSLYIGAAIACFFANSLDLLLVARVVQGFGAAFPRIVSLALMRDLFRGREMAKVMSFVMMVFALVPAVAPLMGQAVISVSGWQTIFLVYIGFAAITMTWLANIYQIITFASQIFVGYYALQSLQAALSAWRLRRFAWVAVYGTGTLIALLVVVFAIPVAA